MNSRGDTRRKTVFMLLTNAYDPDPRVRQEALALIGMGCRVRLLAWDRDLKAPATQCMEGVEVERVFLSSAHGRGTLQLFFYAWLYVKMFWRGMRTSFDVVHCHDLDTLPLGFMLGKLKGTPIVYDAHESFTDMLEGSVHRVVLRGLVHIENFLIRRIDLLITVGEKLRRHFIERGARHSVVVGNWKRLGDFSRSEEQNLTVRHQLGIPAVAMVIVCITQLLKDRKIEELLQAIDQYPNAYVIVGGKGALEDLIVRTTSANPRVLYVGFVSGKRIADLTCAGDVVYYGFDPKNPNARFSAPNKLYEALAAGRPLITGDFGEIADVVRETECGIVLPEYSAEEIRKSLTILENRECAKLDGCECEKAWEGILELGSGRRDSTPRVFGVPSGRARESFVRRPDDNGSCAGDGEVTSMPIRIMHIVDTLAVGGLQNGLANLIDRMDMARFEHVVCAMRPIDEANTQRFSPSGARMMSLSTGESASRFQIGALARRICTIRPDIVHTRNWGTSEGQLAARHVGGCSRIHSEHGIDWDTTTAEPRRRILLRRLAFQLANRVVSVSYQLRDLHARRTGFSARKITVIHNGVDSRQFFPDASVRGRVRRELGVGESELCIGCLGNLIPVKDHITLLKAVNEFAKCGRPWRLLIAGDGPELPKLAEFVNGYEALKDCVTFLGRSSSVPELLNAMDVYVSSSLTEGISNSVLEAMATGLPVVITATGGNPEVVVDGESGLLFPVGDWPRLANHLGSLEAQRELRTALGQNARQRVRDEFSIDSMVGNYTRIYENLPVAGVTH